MDLALYDVCLQQDEQTEEDGKLFVHRGRLNSLTPRSADTNPVVRVLRLGEQRQFHIGATQRLEVKLRLPKQSIGESFGALFLKDTANASKEYFFQQGQLCGYRHQLRERAENWLLCPSSVSD